MQKNVGGYDRIARLVLGPVLVILAAAWYAGVGVAAATTTAALVGVAILALVGVVFVVTGYTQKCPLNRAFKLNTYRSRNDEETESDAGTGRPSS